MIRSPGTQSIRSALVDTQGNVEHLAKVAIEPYFSAEPGWAEQHPTLWWDNLKILTRKLWARSSIDPSAVCAIGISYQMHGLVLLDESGHVLAHGRCPRGVL